MLTNGWLTLLKSRGAASLLKKALTKFVQNDFSRTTLNFNTLYLHHLSLKLSVK